MDPSYLPLDVQKIIFSPAYELDAQQEDPSIHQRREYLHLILTLRLVCRRWKSMTKSLPVWYTVKKGEKEEIERFAELFPSCKRVVISTSACWYGFISIRTVLAAGLGQDSLLHAHDPATACVYRSCNAAQDMYHSFMTLSSRGRLSTALEGLDVLLTRAAKSLARITLSRATFPEGVLSQIAQLPLLQKLELRSCRYSSGHLSNISALHNLDLLFLSQQLTAAEIASIGKLTKLQHLVVVPFSNGVFAVQEGADLMQLSCLTRLEHFGLSNSLKNDASLRCMYNMSRLTSFSGLHNASHISANVLRELGSRLPRVSNLGLYDLLRNDERCRAVCTFSGLRTFRFDRYQEFAIRDEAFADISSLQNLFVVAITSPLFGSLGMSAVCSLPTLKRLSLFSCTGIPPHSFYLLSRLTALQSIEIARNEHLPADAIECFASPSLVLLSLVSTPTRFLAPLTRCTQLNTLVLSRTHVTDDSLRVLTGLTALQALELEGVPTSGEFLIGAQYRLRTLSLYTEYIPGTPSTRDTFTREGAMAIAKLNLSWMDFGNMTLRPETLQIFAAHGAYRHMVLLSPEIAHLDILIQHATTITALRLYYVDPKVAEYLPNLSVLSALTDVSCALAQQQVDLNLVTTRDLIREPLPPLHISYDHIH